MDLVNKICLAEKHKGFVLSNDNLSGEQKVILYNEFFKKHLFKKIKISNSWLPVAGTENLLTVHQN